MSNDKILSLNGNKISLGVTLKKYDKDSKEIDLVVERNQRPFSTVTRGRYFRFIQNRLFSFELEKLSLGESIVEGFEYGYWTLEITSHSLSIYLHPKELRN